MIRGITISFAGKPNINASSIVPSRPIILANGSKAPEHNERSVSPPNDTFANTQITSPAGAAMLIALPRTNSVRSRIDRTITPPMFGLRYGGSSSVNDEG